VSKLEKETVFIILSSYYLFTLKKAFEVVVVSVTLEILRCQPELNMTDVIKALRSDLKASR